MKRLAALGALLLVPGCVSLEYYVQAVGGHLEVMRLAVPIEERLREADTPEPLRAKLAKVLAIREFASRELALPDNASYRSYSALHRPYAVWNVVATPEFSVEPRRWPRGATEATQQDNGGQQLQPPRIPPHCVAEMAPCTSLWSSG